MRDSPALLLQLAVCLAQFKGITRKKSHTFGILPATLSATLGLCAYLPPSPVCCFFSPAYRKKTASVCQLTLNAAMKPGLTKVFLSVAPGITSPQTLYLIIDGADLSCLAQVCPSPDVSCTPRVRTKKRLSPNTSFHLVRKAPPRPALFRVSGLIVFVVCLLFFFF